MSSISENLRSQGNEFYTKYQNSSNLQDQKRYLEKAMNLYYRSFETADKRNYDEKSKAAKNYAMASWKTTNILLEINETPALVQHSFKETISYFSKALAYGQSSGNKSSEWMNSLTTSFSNCCDAALEQIKYQPYLVRSQMIENYLSLMVEDSQKAGFYMELLSVTHKAGLVALEKRDFQMALNAFHDCFRPVEECQRLASDNEYIATESRVISADLQYNLTSAESMKAIFTADQHLKSTLRDSEILDLDAIYDVVDWYRLAIVKTREVELENEAIALSRLAYMYDAVLKMKSKAREYVMECLHICNALAPKSFHSQEWYQTATAILQRYQKETVEKEEQRLAKEKLRVDLQPIFNQLNQANVGSGPDALLRFIYKEHPPKNPTDVLVETDFSDRAKLKKIVVKAIHHYHPDRQAAYQDDRWTMICDEITKLLNNHYQITKGDLSD